MTRDVELRAFLPADRTAHDALMAELDGWHHAALPTRVRPAEQCRLSEEEYARRITQEDILYLGAFAGPELLGLIHATFHDQPTQRRHQAKRVVRIEEIVVAREARRRGIGRELMGAAQKWGDARGAGGLELHVYAINSGARAFYRSEGFEDIALRLEKAISP